MRKLSLEYIGHVSAITNRLAEEYNTKAVSLRDLVEELEQRYRGFRQVFIDHTTGQLNLNAMIYYASPGELPSAILNLDQPVHDGSRVTFW